MKDLIEVLEKCRSSSEFSQYRRRPLDINQHGSSGDTPLHLFSMRGDLEAVQVLLSAGADISAIGEREDTALFSAIMGENIEVVKYLVEHGCPLDHRNEDGKTALDFAKSLKLANALGNPEVIPLLEGYLKRGPYDGMASKE